MRKLLHLAAALALTLWAPAAWAAYPDRDITLVVGWGPGGITDVAARTLVPYLEKNLGVKVIVQNEPGATGAIGAAKVANAPPDGYTLLFAIGAHTILPAINAELPYDTVTGFTPVMQIASAPNLVVVRSDFPAKTIQAFVAEVKANPGKYNYASPGFGTTTHITMATLSDSAGLDMVHIPYQGSPQTMQALLGKEIDILPTTVFTGLQYIRSGELVPLAIVGPTRAPQLPDLPTFDEAGLAGVRGDTWTGILAPAGTPQPVIERLGQAVAAAIADPAFAATLEKRGQLAVGSDSATFQTFIASEVAAYLKLRDAGKLKPAN